MKMLAILFALLWVTSIPAMAEDPPSPVSFSVESADGERVFFFNPGNMSGTYPASGLYYNTEPPELIYTVEGNLYWAFEHSFVFSEDLRYFALIAPMAYPIALEFYANGVLLREYGMAELVGDMSAVQQGDSTAAWLQEHNLDSAYNIFIITTIDGLRYEFDLATGEMIEGAVVESPPAAEGPAPTEEPIALTGGAVNLVLLFAIIGGGVSLVVIIDILVSRKRRKQPQQQPSLEHDYFDFR